MRRFFFIFFTAISAVFFFLPYGSAQTGLPSDQLNQHLIQEFKEANQSGDQDRLRSAYQALKINPSAVEFLQKNFPQYYQLYKAWALVERVESMKVRYGNRGFVIEEGISTPQTIRGLLTNQDTVENSPNQNVISNQNTVWFMPNQKRYRFFSSLSNSRRVMQNPNQDRISNSDRARRDR